MRIIAGANRGARIFGPKGEETRPTSDRVREAAFNLIGPVDGAAVLDLFAGSGAMGLEALSRGAATATFVESDRDACRTIDRNLEKLRLTGATVLPGRVVAVRDGLRQIALDGGLTLWSADEGDGEVNVAVYPWDVSLGSYTPDDSRMNHLSAAVVSVAPMGNRTRVRVGPIVAEITAASAERLDLRPGVLATASFKATAARLYPR